jgi:hypothetical protein
VFNPFTNSERLREHMDSPKAQVALRFNGITRAEVEAASTALETTDDLREWLDSVRAILLANKWYLTRWASYNAEFAVAVMPAILQAHLPPMGPDCLMQDATSILHAHGAARKKRDGTPMYAGLKKTTQWLQGRGYDIPAPDSTVAGNLAAASYVASALDVERPLVPQPNPHRDPDYLDHKRMGESDMGEWGHQND